MELKAQRAEANEPDDEATGSPAEIADLRFHLAKARLRVAVESLDTAERLLRASGHEDEAQKLVDAAKRELESLKSLVRGDGGGVV